MQRALWGFDRSGAVMAVSAARRDGACRARCDERQGSGERLECASRDDVAGLGWRPIRCGEASGAVAGARPAAMTDVRCDDLAERACS